MRSETRHQLKKDPFAHTIAEKAGTTMHWAAENRSRVILWGGAVVVILAIVVGAWFYQRRQEHWASLALADAMSTYNAPIVPAANAAEAGVKTFPSEAARAAAANTEFRKVADKYSTASGKIARYMTGLTSEQMGATADAERDLKQVADKGDKELASLANLALASLYRQTNRSDEALKIYKQLEQHPTNAANKPMVQLETAAVYASRNENDKAREIYEQVAKDNAATAIAQVANQRMAGLKK